LKSDFDLRNGVYAYSVSVDGMEDWADTCVASTNVNGTGI